MFGVASLKLIGNVELIAAGKLGNQINMRLTYKFEGRRITENFCLVRNDGRWHTAEGETKLVPILTAFYKKSKNAAKIVEEEQRAEEEEEGGPTQPFLLRVRQPTVQIKFYDKLL